VTDPRISSPAACQPEFLSEPRELAADSTWDLGTITFARRHRERALDRHRTARGDRSERRGRPFGGGSAVQEPRARVIARSRSERREVKAEGEPRAQLVERDVTVAADAEELQLHAAGARQHFAACVAATACDSPFLPSLRIGVTSSSSSCCRGWRP